MPREFHIQCRSCGKPFTRHATLVRYYQKKRYTHDAYYWCDECDGHASGCKNHQHPFGQCVYE